MPYYQEVHECAGMPYVELRYYQNYEEMDEVLAEIAELPFTDKPTQKELEQIEMEIPF
ncbi:MAG: hypothetical protein VKL42_08940 [Snowella sp.]|nr:hypothetical protein [Snowella sp.]